MAVPKISDLRTWDGTQFTNDDYDYNSQTIVNWLANKQADLDVNTVRTANGVDAANSKITNVAPATAGTDAVNLDQLNTISSVNNQYIPYTLASGKVNASGYADYLQKDSDTQLTILAGNTNPDLVVIQSDGTLETLTDNVVLAISVSNGTYTIVKEKDEAPILTSSTVSTGVVFPSAPVNGDYFLLTSGRPYQGYQYASVGGWGEMDFISMGSATVASGVATLTTLNYNSPTYVNGQRTVINTYVNGTEWYRIWSDGWIEQGGYTTSNVTLHTNFSNTSYTVQLTGTQTIAGGYVLNVYNKTTSGFSIYTSWYSSGSAGGTGYWYACGF